MSSEPLTITFTRTGGHRPELKYVERDAELGADDERTWMGTERPRRLGGVAHEAGDKELYRLVFRRGSERRVVELRYDDLTAHTRPLVERLLRKAEGRLR